MLNEKLMKALDSIQDSICLQAEKKLVYVITDDFAKVAYHCNDGLCTMNTAMWD